MNGSTADHLSTVGRPVGADPSTLATITYGALALTVAPMLYLHIAGARIVDPLRATVSDYVSVPGGAVLLAIGTFALAVATAVAPFALVRGGLRRPAPVCVLFGLGALGLIASVAFPTNPLGSALSESAVLHRYAAGLFFVSMPIAGFLARRRGAPGRWLGPLWVTSLVVGLLFLASHIPLIFPQFPWSNLVSAVLPRGLVERALLLVNILLVGSTTLAARRAYR